MKIKPILSAVLMGISAALAAWTIGVVSYAMTAEPVVKIYPEDAEKCAESLVESLRAGDYGAASGVIYGTPVLGTQPAQVNPAAEIIWAEFRDSLEFEILGELYPKDAGMAVDVRVRSLDVSRVTSGLDQRARAELNKRMEQAEDISEIYDEKNDYRQELVQEVLCASVEQALAENENYREQKLSLRLVYDQEQWWVLPESDLLNVLSGSISG